MACFTILLCTQVRPSGLTFSLDILESKALPLCQNPKTQCVASSLEALVDHSIAVRIGLSNNNLAASAKCWKQNAQQQAMTSFWSLKHILHLRPPLPAYCIRMHKERTSVQKHRFNFSPHLLVRMDLRPFKVDLSLNLGPAGLCAMDASFRRSNLLS